MDPTTVECAGCGKPVNERFAACPFCGQQLKEKAAVRATSLDKGHRPNPAGVMADSGLSKEARIAMAQSVFTGRQPGADRVTGASSGLLSALMPSSNTRGWLRYLEIVLTVISLPFFVVSLVGIVFQGVKRWGKIDVFSWVAGALFGTPVILFLLYMIFDISFGALVWIVAVGLGAWFARGVVRWIGSAQRLNDYS